MLPLGSMPSLKACAECETLLGEVIDAVNAHTAELRTLSEIAGNGAHPQFVEVGKRAEETLSAVLAATEQ